MTYPNEILIPMEYEGALYYRPLEDAEIVVYPMTFGKARVCLGSLDRIYIIAGFCYADPARALEAARVWDGEGDPLPGWHRETATGRRMKEGREYMLCPSCGDDVYLNEACRRHCGWRYERR